MQFKQQFLPDLNSLLKNKTQCDDDEYGLNVICKDIMNVINNTNVEPENWKVVLNSIRSVCITAKCRNEQDVDLLNETIDNALQLYANKFN